MAAIPVLKRYRREDPKFEASMSYIVRPHLNKIKLKMSKKYDDKDFCHPNNKRSTNYLGI